jgi:hypothetical protein
MSWGSMPPRAAAVGGQPEDDGTGPANTAIAQNDAVYFASQAQAIREKKLVKARGMLALR